jgi:hypothetical protein
VPSRLDVTFWSVLPYAFGSSRFAKYRLEPSAVAANVTPAIQS